LAALEENPYYPSLLSLSKTFDQFNIPNEAYRLKPEELDNANPPFVAYLKNQPTGSDFVLVTKMNDDKVCYLSDSNSPTIVSREKFIANWEHIIFISEKHEKSGEKNYRRQLKEARAANLRKLFLYAGAVIILFTALTMPFISGTVPVLATLAILLTKSTGLACTLLLLRYESGYASTFINHLCSTGPNTSCDAVLKSKASKIAGISWSEAGLFYFTGTMLLLLFPGMSYAVKASLLGMAATAVSPYIIFSLYYQWRVAKRWCPLCLTVQAVLAAELLWSILFAWLLPLPAIELNTMLCLLLCALVPVTVWFSIKPVILAAKDEPVYRAAYKRLLHNPDILNFQLQQQPEAPEGYETLGITLGNPFASNTIIKVCNPYCNPCAEAHTILEEIIDHNNDVKVKLIFAASNQQTDPRGPAARHLLAIAARGNVPETAAALHEWYGADKKDYGAFASRHPADDNELKAQEGKIDAMREWCGRAGITGTPTIFVNGRKMPDTYKIQELNKIF
ncbi:MAG TPA: vitamin K epoxide reductase family protein, partial [Chitinophagaceae bacterium]|nr:vitamin K epoxide reductase family protein [Chitinophagaceae bacterium]